MENIQQTATQVMLSVKQLKMYGMQGDEDKQDEVIERLQSVMEDVSEDDGMAGITLYLTASQAILTVYTERKDYIMAFYTCFDALKSLCGIAGNDEDEKSVTTVCVQLNTAIGLACFLYRDIEDEEKRDKCMEILRILMLMTKKETDALRYIKPTSQVLNFCEETFAKLHNAGIYEYDDDGDGFTENIEAIADRWYDIFADDDEDSRFEDIDEENPTDEDKDRVLSPLFEDIKSRIDYDRLLEYLNQEAKEDPEETLSDETDFFKSSCFFYDAYEDYCREKNIEEAELVEVNLEKMFPYCPSVIVTATFGNFRNAYMSASNTFGLLKHELTEDLDDDDKLMEIAERAPERLQQLIMTLVGFNIDACGVAINNDQLFEWAKDYDNDKIADRLNILVDKLYNAGLLSENSHYTEDFVSDILDQF